MDSKIIAALIMGICTILAALGAVYLKEYLDNRKDPSPDLHLPQRADIPTKTPVARDVIFLTDMKVVSVIRREIIFFVSSLILTIAGVELNRLFDINNGFMPVVPMISLLISISAMILFHSRKGSEFAFQIDNFTLCSGWSIGICLANEYSLNEFVSSFAIFWSCSCIIGRAVFSFGKKERLLR